jgi:hypothetical protein
MDPASEPPRRPWWLSSRARLAVLSVLLLGVVGIAFAGSGSGSTSSSSQWCRVPSGAPSELLTLSSLQTLARRGGLDALARGGRHELQGVQGPAVAWGNRPAATSAEGPVGGGYELSWTAEGGEREVLDVFRFDSAADAAYYAAQAGGTGCRFEAATQRLALPRAARAVSWLNQHGLWESDVLFARGSVAYRVSVTAARAPRNAGRAQVPSRPPGLSAQPLACRLAAAGCSR